MIEIAYVIDLESTDEQKTKYVLSTLPFAPNIQNPKFATSISNKYKDVVGKKEETKKK